MFQLPLLFAQESASEAVTSVEDFFGLGQDDRFVVLLVAIGCATGALIAITAIVCNMVGSFHRRSAEYNLKRDMLDRGMTAEEISQVIQSAAPPEDGVERWIASWGKGTGSCKKTV